MGNEVALFTEEPFVSQGPSLNERSLWKSRITLFPDNPHTDLVSLKHTINVSELFHLYFNHTFHFFKSKS